MAVVDTNCRYTIRKKRRKTREKNEKSCFFYDFSLFSRFSTIFFLMVQSRAWGPRSPMAKAIPKLRLGGAEGRVKSFEASISFSTLRPTNTFYYNNNVHGLTASTRASHEPPLTNKFVKRACGWNEGEVVGPG